jgi:mitochondrial fission protein ELM1
VYLFAPPGLISDKHARLHSNLIAGAHARPFEGTLDLGWQPERLDVASEIAAEIRVRGFVA